MAYSKKLEIKGIPAEVINYSFQSLLVLYLLLLLIEQLWVGSISFYLNLNYLLVLVIILGVLDVFSEKKDLKKEKPTKKDYFFIVILGIAGFFIIKTKTSQLGWLSWVISIIAGILIILLSLLVLEEDEEEKPKKTKPLTKKQKSFITFSIIISLFIISLFLDIFTKLSFLESIRIVFGSVYVLFLPGFLISYIFFPENKAVDSNQEGIDWIERIALSFALSIAVVPLVVFYLNLLGVRINLLNSFLTILGVICISLGILLFKNKNQHKYS